MPKITHLRPDDYKIQKWKNGTGTTSQLAIEPTHAEFPVDRYSWRVSSARVNASGPFSKFPGFDRILVLVEGSELDLGDLGRLKPFEILRFDGEREAASRHVSGELIDYNVFWRRDEFQVDCEVLRESARRSWATDEGGRLSHLVITALGAPLWAKVAGAAHALSAWESLRIDCDDAREASLNLDLLLAAPGSRAILTVLRARADRGPSVL
jgi:environmental stress-induced protein Ves